MYFLRFFVFLTAAFFISLKTCGQNLLTSHLIWNLPTYNLGALTPSNFARITFDYHKAGLTEGVSFTSASAWMDYPLLYHNKNSGAFFVMIDKQKSGDDRDFNTIQIQGALAKKILLTPLSYISFGLGAGYRQFSMSLDGFTTASQYVEGIGFDPSLPNGESSGYYNSSYLIINSGLYYRVSDVRNVQMLCIGLSAENLNKQLKSWGDFGSTLPVLWSSQLQYLALTDLNIAVGPDFEFFMNGNQINGVGGLLMRYYFMSPGITTLKEDNCDYLNFFARIATQKKGSLGFQLTNGKVAAGFSYEFPFGRLSEIYNNAFEFLFTLKPEITGHFREKGNRFKGKRNQPPVNKKPVTNKKPAGIPPVTKKNTNPDQPVDSVEQILPDSTVHKPGSGEGKIKAGSIQDFKPEIIPEINPVYFISGSSDLEKESRDYLERIYNNYLKSGEYRMVITGHADNTGSREFNFKLSLNRAKMAGDYLLKLGADAKDISIEGKGEDDPLVPNDTPVGRAHNRRVEIKLEKK